MYQPILATTFSEPAVVYSIFGWMGLGSLAILSALCAAIVSSYPARVDASLRIAMVAVYLSGLAACLAGFAFIIDAGRTLAAEVGFLFLFLSTFALFVSWGSVFCCRKQKGIRSQASPLDV